MALELCSESSGWAFSPRISFSQDLSENNDSATSNVNREDSSLLLGSSSSSDFDFCVLNKCEQESSSADELFCNGQILPRDIKKSEPPPLLNLEIACDQEKESFKQITEASADDNEEEGEEEEEEGEEKRASKSFWGFGKSSSLNCTSGSKSSLMCSLSGLRRSHSAGSDGSSSNSNTNPNHKRLPSKENKFSQKPSSVSSSFNTKPYSGLPKSSPLKKNEGGRTQTTATRTTKTHYSSYNNGVRISPVLNVPPPYISRGTSNLFNLGYFLGKKEKNKRNPYSTPP